MVPRVSGDVPAKRDRRSSRTVVLLRRIVHAYLSEVQDNVFGQAVRIIAGPGANVRDKDFLHLDLDVLERLLSGFANGKESVLVMGTFTTGEHQLGRAAVHEFGNRDVLHIDFAAACTSADLGGAVVSHSP